MTRSDSGRLGTRLEDWRRQAACRFMPADLFFPAGTSGVALEEILAAKAVCARCDVVLACRGYALETRQEFGIWGGTDEEERRARLRRPREGHPLRS